MSDGFEMDEMKEIIDSFVVEVAEHIDNLDQNLVELEDNAEDYDLLNQIFRAAHTIKGAASFLDFNLMAKVTHHAESVLDALRKGKMKVTPEIMDVILEAIDVIKEIFEEIKEQYREKEGRDLSGIIAKLESVLARKEIPKETTPKPVKETKKDTEKKTEQVDKQEEKKEKEKDVEKTQAVKPPEKKAKAASSISKRSEETMQTIRVDLKRLDNVMNLVQELVPGRNRLVQISKVFKSKLMESQKRLEDAFTKNLKEQQVSADNQIQKKAKKKFNDDIIDLTEIYDEVTSQIDLITTELQSAVMKTRMLPISNVFNKFPRMVRDLAREEKKTIKLEMEGKETELDKSVIEIIGDPLMHCIRNSVDHAIELPDDREKNGKSREGKIILSAFHEGNYIVVKVIDDGKGMDPDVLRKKAIEKGIYSEEEAGNISDRDILTVIFQPGFSTAKQVTNVSGRGVGMDVLKSNIEKLNGIIDVDSTLGEGSTVTIKIPLTLAIIQALLVRVKDDIHDEIYAIPLSSVIETVRIHKSEIKTIKDNQVYRLRDTVLPLLSLGTVFDLNNEKSDSDHTYVVVLGLAEKRVGLMVDGLLGQEEVVVKSIGDFFDDTPGIAGATIMGDGRVRLIVNVSDLVDLGHRV